MRLSTKAALAHREAEMIMVSKAFRLLAIELSKASPARIEPALHCVMQMVATDLAALAKEFPNGIGPYHPVATTAIRFHSLIEETRQDIAKAAKPH